MNLGAAFLLHREQVQCLEVCNISFVTYFVVQAALKLKGTVQHTITNMYFSSYLHQST